MQQVRRQLQTIVLLMGTWAAIQPAAAQYSSNNQTNTISGVTNFWTGDYVVGSNTFANALLIRNGGLLSNANSYAAYLSASSNNYVLVTGSNSVWSNGNMFLGQAGGGNSMVISNAGRVVNTFGTYIGSQATSSSNRVLVTGTNSTLDCADNLSVGYSGSGNSLVISNGARVNDEFNEVGREWDSSGNTALVTGAGSFWSNQASCTIGRSGSFNQMSVRQGGRARSSYASIGMMDSANSNSIVISDNGSVWDNSAEASDINFGVSGSGNRLIITNGGKVLAYYAYFGRMPGASHNSGLVADTGSTFQVQCYIYAGNQGNNNSFTAANGATIEDKFCYISHDPSASNNAVLVTGTNTSWHNSYSVIVGLSGVNASLTISNGATMSATEHGVLGFDASSQNNRALVTGGGSLWNCTLDMNVGLNGRENTLVISNGGRVTCQDGYVGGNPGSDTNNALVVGANSVWSNNADLRVGAFSLGNTLVISNAARVIGQSGFVGRNSGADGNSAIVTGPGSVWTNNADTYVGCFGAGNSLVISNGGRVTDDWGVIGYNTNSSGNQVLVTGANSVWSNDTVTFVGQFGSGNTLTIRDGGLVTGYWGLIGEEEMSVDNMVYVESGGTWRCEQLCVGNLGSHNAMFVNGGSVSASTYMAVGFNPTYCNNYLELNDGVVMVTNVAQDAVLEVYGGSVVILGGTLRVDTLLITNDCAQFVHMGGTLIYRNLVLDPAFDPDLDGIPSGWEQSYGLNPLDPFDGEADADGDKMSNWQECMAGTNPTNAASCLALTSLALTNGNTRVNWKAVGGKSYVVQTNSGSGTGFVDASPVIAVPGSGEKSTNYLDPGAATNGPTRVYRLRLAP